MTAAPSVLVFDVNETLIDINSMAPLFERIFGDPRLMRDWFGHLVTYSMAATLSGRYIDFFTLGQGLVRMLANIHGVNITDDDVQSLKRGMLTMPAHSDVEDGLKALRQRLPSCDSDELTTQSRWPNPAGTRWAGLLF
jgi:2-haloacid dehalogenase